MNMGTSIDQVKQLYQAGHICLFVGAGLSASCGLPDWKKLSDRIIAETWPNTVTYDYERPVIRANLSGGSPLDAMRMARRELKDGFNSMVAKCLYADAIQLSSLARAIPNLSKINRVCCFNFDDVLERAYTDAGRRHHTLVNGSQIPSFSEDVLIYHPHGFLPHQLSNINLSSSPIILSEDDYHDMYAQPYSWANLIQIGLLQHYCALFVGCSLIDPSMRRLLDVSRKLGVAHSHFALLKDPTYQPNVKGWDLFAFPPQKKMLEKSLEDRGVIPLWFNEYADIANILLSISN